MKVTTRIHIMTFKYSDFVASSYICRVRNRSAYCLAAAAILILLAAADILWGGNAGADAFVVTKIRLPRVATALLAGAGLALGGLQMQSIFRNPLADPHIMGVSAGAGLGAAIALMAGAASAAFGGITLTASAFIGAALASALILGVSSKVNSTYGMLIFGIMLGFAINAVTAIFQFTSTSEALKIYYNWAVGSLSNCSWPQIAVMGGCLLAGLALATCNMKGLNLILFGDEYTTLSGGDTRRIRFMAMASTCLIAGSITAFCGPLGFIGIVAPHIARRLAGSNVHGSTIPFTMIAGAGLTVAADFVTQLCGRWFSPLPVGSMLALIGIPLILAILIKGRQHGSN